MKRNKYHIDNMYFAKSGQKIQFCINGWYLPEAELDYKLILLLDGKRWEAVQSRRIARKDVCEAAGISDKGVNLGFSLRGECLPENLKKKLQIRFEAVSSEKRFCISYWRIQALVKKKTICSAIDIYDMENDLIVIRGWALSPAGEELKYRVLNQDGGQVKARISSVRRPDVQELFQLDSDSSDAGFQMEFECEKDKKYRLVIESGKGKEQYPVNPEKIRRAVRRRNSRYMSVREIAKSLTPRQILSDGKYLVKHGGKNLKQVWKERYASKSGSYECWRMKNALSGEVLEAQRKKKFAYEPVISVVVPTYCTPKKYLIQMIDSVQKQTYKNWELCIADGSEEDASVEKAVKDYLKDKRIRYQKLEKNEKISGNTNKAIEMASGDFVGFLDHDDLLTEDALYEMVKATNQNMEADVLYSDEDKVSADLARYMDPYFKSDFNLDLLRSNNYICHFLVVRRTVISEAGMLDEAFDGAQDHDFILRCAEKARKIVHIPQILYHWRVHHNSTAGSADNKAYCDDAGKRAIEAHLSRCGVEGTVHLTEHAGFYRTEYKIASDPLVSILIPNRNERESLKTCIESILEKTTYQNYELVIIENNSTEKDIFEYYKELEKNPRIRVIYWEREFNYSAINNFGAGAARGDYLVLLNNDTEIIEPKWLSRMLGDCQRPEVGMVGAKLCYPDDTIQHAGVIIGIGGVAGHIFKYFVRDYTGYFMKAQLQQNLSAVTAACLMVKKTVFDEVGGLEEDLRVAFNDVDFCLKVREKGYLIVYEPGAELYHYESKSRGSEDTPEKVKRFNSEADYMMEKWKEFLKKGDPYYNKNLTLEREDCSLKMN